MGIKRRTAGLVAKSLSSALRLGGRPFYRYVMDALWERQPFFEASAAQKPLDVRLYYPGYVAPDASQRPLVERIFVAYEKAKETQRHADPVFLPSSAWQTVIDGAFAPLSEGLADRNLEVFHHFLANFRSWKRTTGMEPSQQISEYSVDAGRRAHFEQRVVAPILRWWLRSESHGRDLSALTIPRYGNQCGVLVDGHLVAASSVFCEVYGRLLAGFCGQADRTERPVVAELGAGFGKLLFFISQNIGRARFVDVDLPESLCCAAFFLMQAFPDARFLLYGEGNLTAESLKQHDFVLLPSFEISKLPERSVGLFINENSLGVMSPAACRRFVLEICRSTEAFYHRNTESSRIEFSDGTQSLVNSEFPVPAQEFEQVARYADISRMMSSGRLNFDSDMYWYYYRRKTR